MSEQMSMQKVVEILKHPVTGSYTDIDVDNAITFLENEMKYPTREECDLFFGNRLSMINANLRERQNEYEQGSKDELLKALHFINTPKEASE